MRGIGREAPRNRGTRTGASQVRVASPEPTRASGCLASHCGEVPLLPYESCNLASINLSHMVRREGAGASIDWEKLGATARLVIRFLDDVLEVGRWPDPRITAMTRANRKVGLGMMGFAELLIRLGIPYADERAVTLADELMRFLDEQTLAASEELARERGVFPNWERSVYRDSGVRVRNATRTSIAPTGTLSIIAGTSPSIEPLFGLAYRRRALDGQTLLEWNPLVLRYAADHGLDVEAIKHELQTRGSLAHLVGASQEMKELFQTALEIPPQAHLAIQEAFQRHVDNAVSKTVNLPHGATPGDVATIYRSAWERGLKGITIYRYGSLGDQVLELGLDETGQDREHFTRCDPHACKL